MSLDRSKQILDSQILEALSAEQLTAIVLQQQITINQLKVEVESLKTELRRTSNSIRHPSNQQFPDPYLLIYTESGSDSLPLVGNSCWTIGRSEENTLVLSDHWISRNHSMIQRVESGEFYLIDLGSRNGTFVNGRRVSVPVALNSGDRLTFGETELEFYDPALTEETDEPTNPSLLEEKGSATGLLHVRRLISVLVVDIRDFTVLTRQLDEKVLSEVIGRWFGDAGEIIREYGSWVDKYIGDAVMAVWIHGADGVDPEEMQQILSALQALHQVTSQLHQHYPLPFPLKIGAGINTGYAMVGNAGSSDRPDYTAVGDTVNAAFRLEGITKQLGLDIALGDKTHHCLSPEAQLHLPFVPHVVNLKGYEAPVTTHAGSFADLDTFLQISSKVDDTLY
jgi:adenylate cyclase